MAQNTSCGLFPPTLLPNSRLHSALRLTSAPCAAGRLFPRALSVTGLGISRRRGASAGGRPGTIAREVRAYFARQGDESAHPRTSCQNQQVVARLTSLALHGTEGTHGGACAPIRCALTQARYIFTVVRASDLHLDTEARIVTTSYVNFTQVFQRGDCSTDEQTRRAAAVKTSGMS